VSYRCGLGGARLGFESDPCPDAARRRARRAPWRPQSEAWTAGEEGEDNATQEAFSLRFAYQSTGWILLHPYQQRGRTQPSMPLLAPRSTPLSLRRCRPARWGRTLPHLLHTSFTVSRKKASQDRRQKLLLLQSCQLDPFCW